MSGKPAARIGDSVSHGVIVTGSSSVLIGSAGGVACAVCPGGMAVGSPVNPALGAKVLSGEVDFALPAAAQALVWQRTYNSYVNAEHGGACGVLGYGWHLAFDLSMVLEMCCTQLFDAQGRVITFNEPLLSGAQLHSVSEGIWLVRGGDASAAWRSQAAWGHVPESWSSSSQCIIASNEDKSLLWRFAPSAEYPERWSLVEQRDRLGCSQIFTYARPAPRQGRGGEAPILLSEIRDGAGRRYVLHYLQLYPDRLTSTSGYGGQAGWQADSGWRLIQVNLLEDIPAPGTTGEAWMRSQREQLEHAQAALKHPSLSHHAGLVLVRYDYHREGELSGVTDRSGTRLREFGYRNHLMVSHRYQDGPQHRYVYEANEPGARVLEQHNEGGLSYTFNYEEQPGQSRAVVTDSLGRQDTYHFSGEKGLKRLVRHERADGSVTEHHYNLAGQLSASVDALGRKHCLWRDDAGRVNVLQDAAGNRIEMQYDASGQLLAHRDAAGHYTRYQYDGWGRLTRTTFHDGRHADYYYPAPEAVEDVGTAHLPRRVKDARGGVKHLNWSPAGHLLAYTDCSGKTTHYQYDRWGDLQSVTAADGQTIRYERDIRGNLVAVRQPDGSVWYYQYDTRARLTGIVAPQDHRYHFAYDSHNRLIGREAPSGHRQHYDYDLAGRVIALHNENDASYRFEYDAMNRLIQESGFDGRIQSYQYDLAGQLIAQTEQSLAGTPTTRFDYDKTGRLSARHLPVMPLFGAISEHYRWSPDGRLLEAASPGSRIEFQYDSMGRAIGERQQQQHAEGSTWHWRHQHEHTALGVRERSSYGELAPIEWLSYGAGHLHGVRLPGVEIELERDDLHREIERHLRTPAYPQLLKRDTQYDTLGNLSAQQIEIGGVTITRQHYHYDALSRLSEILDEQRPEMKLRYHYDRDSRLIGSQHGPDTFHYALDPAGNRIDPNPAQPEGQEEDWRETVRKNLHDPNFNVLEHLAPTSAPNAAHQWFDNRITELEGIKNTYDGAGNLIQRNLADGTQLNFHYDGAHRLTYFTLSEPDGSCLHAFYAYDALSRRIYREVQSHAQSPVATCYGWDGDRLVHEETAGQKTTIVYEPGSFVPLARIEHSARTLSAEEQALVTQIEAIKAQLIAANQAVPAELQINPGPLNITLFITDHLGTPQKLIDLSGQTVWEAEPDDWRALKNQHGVRQPIRFQGQWEDEESGLYYNRYRYYDPAQGRYASQDPIGLGGGVNNVIYPLNPVAEVDPLGLKVKVVAANPNEAKALQEAYARLNKTARGRAITGPIESSSDTYYIRPKHHAAYYCSPGAAANPNPSVQAECGGHPRTVFLDPNNNLVLPTTAGMQPASKACILGHELGHADGTQDDGPGKMNNVILNENPIRAQLGEPARTAYPVAPPITWSLGRK